MKLYEYPILEQSRGRYLWVRVQRFCILPLRALYFVLRLPIIVLVAFFLESRYAERRDPPSWIIRRILKIAYRNTPRVLVCMPFKEEQSETAYQQVVRPLITKHFGGTCVRFSHPVVDGDWPRALRRALLSHTIVVFDLSFRNKNVELERRYYDSMLRSIGDLEHRHIDLRCVEQPPEGRFRDGKALGTSVLHYNDDLIGLMDLADRFRDRMQSCLLALRFQRGIVNPWILYPMARWEVPEGATWLDGRTWFGIERDWVEDEDLPEAIGKLGA